MEPNQRNRNEKEGRVKGNNTVEPNERNRQEREGRVKVNYYCGTKPEVPTGKGREIAGKRVLWNEASGNDRKGKGE